MKQSSYSSWKEKESDFLFDFRSRLFIGLQKEIKARVSDDHIKIDLIYCWTDLSCSWPVTGSSLNTLTGSCSYPEPVVWLQCSGMVTSVKLDLFSCQETFWCPQGSPFCFSFGNLRFPSILKKISSLSFCKFFFVAFLFMGARPNILYQELNFLKFSTSILNFHEHLGKNVSETRIMSEKNMYDLARCEQQFEGKS